jgi:hypothetical protein
MGFGSDFANNIDGGGGAIMKSLGAPDLLSAPLHSALNRCTVRPLTKSDIPDAVKYSLDLLKMSIRLLETC